MNKLAIVLIICASLGLYAQEEQQIRSKMNITLPDLKWSIPFNTTGYAVKENNISRDGNIRFVSMVNDSTQMFVSVRLEQAPSEGDMTACREYYWKKEEQSPVKKYYTSFSVADDKAFADYMVMTRDGAAVKQKNINVYMSKDGYWIDIHLAKDSFAFDDMKYFNDIIDAIDFSEYYHTRSDYFSYGANFYMKRNYVLSAKYYQNLLDMEIAEPTMVKQTYWYVLVNNLGMSYAVSGNPQKAKEVFEYGIGNDNQYPLFYYNLACVNSLLNDLDNCLKNIELAFRFRDRLFEGEEIPNPMKDPAFRRYRDNDRFKALIEKYNK